METFLTGFWYVTGGICGLIFTITAIAIIVGVVRLVVTTIHEIYILLMTIIEKLRGNKKEFVSLYKSNRWLYS